MNKLDLVIIHPGAAHGIYGELGNELVAIEPPLWCRLIAGYVRDRGHGVQIIDAEARGLTAKECAQRVVGLQPRLVAIAVYGHQPSASTQQMDAAGEIARAIKAQPNHMSRIIMVGGHVSALPERTMREETIDFACLGEGPITIERLLAGDKEADIPGLVWWRGLSELVVNPPAPLIEDLAHLHGDVWDLLPMGLYRAHNWQCFGRNIGKRQPYASIYTSLGCPYRCAFCCINAPFGAHRYRMRKPDDVVNEIECLVMEHGVFTFKIVDEMFVLNERHYMEIAQRLAEFNASDGLNIWAYARVDTIKPHTLALLRRAGIRWLALGIESGSAHVRDGASKRLKHDDIEATVRAIQAADINVIANYIFGLPDDNLSTMQETLSLALLLNTGFANFYSAMAYPGSRLYTDALELGWTLPETWRGYSQHNADCRPLDTLHVDAATVLRFRDEAFQTYFTNPAYLDMVGRKFGPATVDHVKRMTIYHLPRKLLGPVPVAAE